MEVILLADVKGVGKKGETKNVKDGYGANFLIPRGLAVKKTVKSMEILDAQKADFAAKQAELKQDAILTAKRLEAITLEFKAKTGADGKMFGTISYKQIEQELKDKFQIVIDKRKIIERTPVDRIGYTTLTVELYKGVNGIIKVHVSEEAK